VTEAAETSRKILKLAERIPENFSCKDGCAECCKTRITVHKAEWEETLRPLALAGNSVGDKLALLISDDPREANLVQIYDLDRECCPFLGEDMQTCQIYDSRPFVCRQYGQHYGMWCCEGVECPPESEIPDEVVVGFAMLMHAGTPDEGRAVLSAEQRANQRQKLETWRRTYGKSRDAVPQTLEDLSQFHANG